MGTKRTLIPDMPGAIVVDLAKYRKKLKSAVRKPRRKKVPTYEIMACEHCGCSNFKFVCGSDIDALRHSVICADCQQQPGPTSLSMVYELVSQQIVRR
jgi:hypothetical protein